MKANNGKELTKKDGVWYDDEGTKYLQCDECDEYYPEDEMTETEDGIVCEDCLDNEYSYCEKCNEYYRSDDFVPVYKYSTRECDPEYWCRTCADYYSSQCDCCGEYFRFSCEEVTSGDNYRGSYLCDGCMDREDIHECSECGVVGDNVYWDEGAGDYFCEDCNPRDGIQSYGKTNDLEWLGDSEELHMGVELEIDKGGYSGDNANKLAEILGHRYCECKKDGSLDEGFEIASSPATYEAHKEELGWENMMKRAIEMGYRSHNTPTCGLHIHVDRNYLIILCCNRQYYYLRILTFAR